MKRLAGLIVLAAFSANAQTVIPEMRRATVKEHLELFATGKDYSSPSFRYGNSQSLRDWLVLKCYTTDDKISGNALVSVAKTALSDIAAKKDGRCPAPTVKPH